MYKLILARRFSPRRSISLFAALAGSCAMLAASQPAVGEQPTAQPIMHKVQGASERLEMVVNSSRILTMDSKMAKAQVNNPDILGLTPLSASEVQVFAKKAGVTQVNLWDEKDGIHAVDVIVFADGRELSMILKSEFPTTSLNVRPLANSVIISGHVDDPAQISRIMEIAADYYPKVINNITVAGVQQVVLRTKVMEVSRTKLRAVGFDFKAISGDDFFQSSIGGILGKVALSTGAITTNGAETMSFGIVNGSDAFFGFLEALRREQIAKIMAEPNLTAYSGRPASFNSGGEFPIIVPQSLGTVSVQYKKFGTEIEFVPIVLGNGAIRLEVKPRVSEIDDTRSVVVNGINVPGLRVREANTGVEMRAGQTLALAGLVFNRTQTAKREIPWLGELPWVGALFRRSRETIDETELLILVTPQFVEAVDACDVPPGGPGLSTSSPNDVQFYLKGHIEVPRCPEDDRCAPSRSPGTAADDAASYHGSDGSYERQGLPADGESIVPLPEARNNGKLLDGGAGPSRVLRKESPARSATAKAAQEQVTVERPARSSVQALPKAATKSASYNQSPRNNPNRPLESRKSAARPAAGTSPGFIGPIGYDVKE